MIILRFVRVPPPKLLAFAILHFKIYCWQMCAMHHAFRIKQAYLGLADARLVQHEAYFEKIIEDAQAWELWAHTNIALARSELQLM